MNKLKPSQFDIDELERNGKRLISVIWDGNSFAMATVKDGNSYVATLLYDRMPIPHPMGDRVYRGSLSKVFRQCTQAAKSLKRNHLDKIRHNSYAAGEYQKSLAKLKLEVLGF